MGNSPLKRNHTEKLIEEDTPSIHPKASPPYISPDLRYKRRILGSPINFSPVPSLQIVPEPGIPSCSQLRNRLYLTLALLMPLKSRESEKSRTAIIYEWDDCLLCTSYLASLKGKAFEAKAQADLKPLDQAIVTAI